jgi:hypothetical protein
MKTEHLKLSDAAAAALISVSDKDSHSAAVAVTELVFCSSLL